MRVLRWTILTSKRVCNKYQFPVRLETVVSINSNPRKYSGITQSYRSSSKAASNSLQCAMILPLCADPLKNFDTAES